MSFYVIFKCFEKFINFLLLDFQYISFYLNFVRLPWNIWCFCSTVKIFCFLCNLNLKVKAMARDIKPTPVIWGKDAVNFYKKLEENRYKKADKEMLSRIEKSVQFFHIDHKYE